MVRWPCSLGGVLRVMGLGEVGTDRDSQGTLLGQLLGDLGEGDLPLEAVLGLQGPKDRVLPKSKTSHKVEKPFLLKNLEGKSHIIIVKILKLNVKKKRHGAAQCAEDAGAPGRGWRAGESEACIKVKCYWGSHQGETSQGKEGEGRRGFLL